MAKKFEWYKEKPWEELDMSNKTKWYPEYPRDGCGSYSKYGNRKTEIDGIIFDSAKEARYYQDLKLLQRGHVVKDFQRQVPFILLDEFVTKDGKKIEAIKYIADFVVNYEDGHQEVVDVKSTGTKKDKVYQLKRKMLLRRYPDINFVEAD